MSTPIRLAAAGLAVVAALAAPTPAQAASDPVTVTFADRCDHTVDVTVTVRGTTRRTVDIIDDGQPARVMYAKGDEPASWWSNVPAASLIKVAWFTPVGPYPGAGIHGEHSYPGWYPPPGCPILRPVPPPATRVVRAEWPTPGPLNLALLGVFLVALILTPVLASLIRRNRQ